jgi:omega-6 fatty acid desaturase (delta-12 desaturase)
MLPRLLTWVVGNANYHHVHHLSARIPNYNLRAAHEEQPIFARTPVVTLRSSIEAFRLKLWDEDRGCLVGFAAAARPATPPLHQAMLQPRRPSAVEGR